MRSFAYLLLCVFFFSCNNESEKIETKDSVAVKPGTSDTAVVTPVDTTTIAKIVKRKSANIAYSYFNSIKRNDLKYIGAYLSIKMPEAKARETLRKIEREQHINSENEDSSIIRSLNIPLVYDSVEIELMDPAADYTIVKTGHKKDKQRIDTVNGNKWEWSVLTKTDKKSTTLILKITAYLPEGSEELENRSIPIRIKLEQSIVRKLWAVLLDDPKYLLTVILVPLIAFFGKRYFDKKKKAKENQT
jgi:hypothetical protein